jgi:hypothetical protein
MRALSDAPYGGRHGAAVAVWQEYRSDPMFSPRHEVSPYVYKGSLWVVAGNSWPLMNDVWRLTLPEAS